MNEATRAYIYRVALAVLAIAALFSTGSLPTRQGQSDADAKVPAGLS